VRLVRFAAGEADFRSRWKPRLAVTPYRCGSPWAESRPSPQAGRRTSVRDRGFAYAESSRHRSAPRHRSLARNPGAIESVAPKEARTTSYRDACSPLNALVRGPEQSERPTGQSERQPGRDGSLRSHARRERAVRSCCRVGGRRPVDRTAWAGWSGVASRRRIERAWGSPAHGSPTSFTGWHTQALVSLFR
jgi:hypothetical protein